jgi:hypothetical protein
MKTVSRLLIVVALSVLSFASEIQGPAKTFGEFGWSIAVSGNTLAISSGPDDSFSAVVYVYQREPGSSWNKAVLVAQLSPDDCSVGSNCTFSSVAISGDTIVAGAPELSQLGESPGGEAFVFVEGSQGWQNATEVAHLLPDTTSQYGGFGQSVAIDGGTIVVGAPNNNDHTGEAYEYTKPSTGWVNATETAQLTPSNGTYDIGFGDSVAVKGVVAAVGCAGTLGQVYVFQEPQAGWSNMTQTAELTWLEGGDSSLGASVAIEGSVIVAGAPNKGSALVYFESSSGWQKCQCSRCYPYSY